MIGALLTRDVHNLQRGVGERSWVVGSVAKSRTHGVGEMGRGAIESLDTIDHDLSRDRANRFHVLAVGNDGQHDLTGAKGCTRDGTRGERLGSVAGQDETMAVIHIGR